MSGKKPARPRFQIVRNRAGDPHLLGYARVSTDAQDLDPQIHALRKHRCSLVFAEKASGTDDHRPGYAALLDTAKKGDTVVVTALDRLGRKLSEVFRVIELLTSTGVHIHDLRSGTNTRTPSGKAFLGFFAVFLEVEHGLIRERTTAGVAAAKRRGKRVGRPLVLTPAKVEQVAHLRAKEYTLREIADATHLGEGSVRRALHIAEARRGDPRQLRIEGA
jgi:DNA invertase Pin-like site-specific DNA recombinase